MALQVNTSCSLSLRPRLHRATPTAPSTTSISVVIRSMRPMAPSVDWVSGVKEPNLKTDLFGVGPYVTVNPSGPCETL